MNGMNDHARNPVESAGHQLPTADELRSTMEALVVQGRISAAEAVTGHGITLVEFLLARIAEDDVTAQAASAGTWVTDWHSGRAEWEVHGENPYWPVTRGHAEMNGEHIARWDPARVLAECDAKRRIIERHEICGSGHGYCDDGGHTDALGCGDLYDLAATYADHPEYREEWRP